MHELSIADAVVQIACRHALGRRVTRVEIEVGHLRQVVPRALSFALELVALGTAVDGAEFVLQPVPARGRCRACHIESELDGFPLACSSCGGFALDILCGEQVLVTSLDVEEPIPHQLIATDWRAA